MMVISPLQSPYNGMLWWLALCVTAFALLYNLYRWILEVRFLNRTLLEILPEGRITNEGDLVRLKKYLSKRIHFDEKRKYERRPLLRQSASTTLKLGHGFCGENARVAILLMALGRVRAHRLYLAGPQWGHVAVEHEWEDGWKLFDAHADPAVYLKDHAVARIDSQDLKSFPNAYSDINPWQRSYRIPLFHRLPVLGALAQSRLPGLLTFVSESPHLIRACVAAVVLGAILCMT